MSYFDDNYLGDIVNEHVSVNRPVPCDLPDYEYIPNRFNQFNLSAEEQADMVMWAREIYDVPGSDHHSDYKPDIVREDRGMSLDKVNSVLVDCEADTVLTRMAPLLVELDATDQADFDSHYHARTGYMLSLMLLVCDRTWEKNVCTYVDFFLNSFDPAEYDYYKFKSVEYDSDDEAVDMHPGIVRFKMKTLHVTAFLSFYSGGIRSGISGRVREALFRQYSLNFNYYPWLEASRDTWMKRPRYESGQLKIFLASLRAFDKLDPQPIFVLVIGSGSHPVRSGYTYPALAQFLTLSGFSGEFHLFDPLETHISCEVGNFQLKYFAQKYVFGSRYEITLNGIRMMPTVILDDLYTSDDQSLSDIANIEQLLYLHPKSRLTTKHVRGKVPPKVSGVTMAICEQFAYTGKEVRLYYRVPTANVVACGQLIGNSECSQCWHYAGLISRIGMPQDDLRPYWTIMYSLAGHHCVSVAGIRNMLYLNALKHEILRGNDRLRSISNVLEHKSTLADINSVGLTRLYDFASKVDPLFAKVEHHYAPNYDMNMHIRERVTSRQIVDVLVAQEINFTVHISDGYSTSRYEQVLEMYSECIIDAPVMPITLYESSPFNILDTVVFVENFLTVDLERYDSVYQLMGMAIVVLKGAHLNSRKLFDRGRCDDGTDYYDL